MSVTIDGTTGVSLVQDGVVTAADLNFGTGKVLQVVAANGRNTDFTTTSSSNVSISNTSITITPTSSSSRIFVTWYGITPHAFGDGTADIFGYSAYRDSTNLGDIGGKRGYSAAGAAYMDQTITLSMIDHPNTTNAVTYSLYGRRLTGNNEAYLHRAFLDETAPKVRMVAMEIEMSTEWES
jgi:hypothetical protein